MMIHLLLSAHRVIIELVRDGLVLEIKLQSNHLQTRALHIEMLEVEVPEPCSFSF